MAAATLQSFNLFLTEKLTAAALDIYGFVEKTVLECQEEVYRTKQENERLQRLLDLVYNPEIRLCRADAKLSTAPTSVDETCLKQEWSVSQDEAGPAHIKEEQNNELGGNDNDNQPPAEDSDEEDALTRELIKTVQQLEDSRAAEEDSEPKESPAEDLSLSEAKTSATFYRCHICNYIFTKKAVLTWHLKTHESKSHDGKGNFDCSILRKHVLAKHKEERPYKCEECNELFTERLLMKRHMRKVHGVKLPMGQSPV
ncbi:hypothetical protein LDENG_00192900 [Lucifuga dentata]|nr:hypothetical protein LDENG_00192900 [Lucifuga dentata]